jgi:hypothetical protein
MNASRGIPLGVAVALIGAGCDESIDPAESQVAADGTQAMMASSQSQSLASVVFENVSVSDPLKAAAELAAPKVLWPAGCVTRTKDFVNPFVVHVTFNNCVGPFGLVHINGEEVVTFSVGMNGALRAHILGVNLTANGTSIAHAATADITFQSASARTVVWQGSWLRVDDAGDIVAHSSDLEVAVDLAAGCRTSNGTAGTHVATRTVDTTVTDYRICSNQKTGAEGCPSGTVVDTGRPQGRTVTVHFDGSATAQVTGPRGNTFGLPLLCVPNGG